VNLPRLEPSTNKKLARIMYVPYFVCFIGFNGIIYIEAFDFPLFSLDKYRTGCSQKLSPQ
jgi:hypothetical protein